jgi:TATA-box binding protein (TBP) (component of TFIID and TFIIIB)
MVTLGELKTFLATLPPEFDEFSIANGEYGKVETDENFYYRLDKPIINIFVNEEGKEICFLHQTQDEVSKIQGEIAEDLENGDK